MKKVKFFLLTSVAFFVLVIVPSVFAAPTDNPFGEITNPLPAGSLGPGGGLIVLLNNILRLVFVVAGIYSFLRVVTGGLSFIHAGGDTKKIETAWNSIWQSLLGVIIILSSIAVAAIMGALFYGNSGAILNPKVYGPGSGTSTGTYVTPPGAGIPPVKQD